MENPKEWIDKQIHKAMLVFRIEFHEGEAAGHTARAAQLNKELQALRAD